MISMPMRLLTMIRDSAVYAAFGMTMSPVLQMIFGVTPVHQAVLWILVLVLTATAALSTLWINTHCSKAADG